MSSSGVLGKYLRVGDRVTAFYLWDGNRVDVSTDPGWTVARIDERGAMGTHGVFIWGASNHRTLYDYAPAAVANPTLEAGLKSLLGGLAGGQEST